MNRAELTALIAAVLLAGRNKPGDFERYGTDAACAAEDAQWLLEFTYAAEEEARQREAQVDRAAAEKFDGPPPF